MSFGEDVDVTTDGQDDAPLQLAAKPNVASASADNCSNCQKATKGCARTCLGRPACEAACKCAHKKGTSSCKACPSFQPTCSLAADDTAPDSSSKEQNVDDSVA